MLLIDDARITEKELKKLMNEFLPDAVHAGSVQWENKEDFVRNRDMPAHPAAEQKEQTVLRIQAFGTFEVFINDMPAHFRYNLTKELLAYLIDRRGAMCTDGELISILWEDGSSRRKYYLKNLKQDLKNKLKKSGCEDILVQHKGAISIRPGKVSCDYYDYLEDDEDNAKPYQGEYMSQYSWAETTRSFLKRTAGKKRDF